MYLVKNLTILMEDKKRKPEKIKQKKGLRIYYLHSDSGGGLSKLTIFFC